VSVCARNQDLFLSEHRVMVPRAMQRLQGQRIRVLNCESFFPFFLWLVASLFVDLEKVLFLTGCGTLWVPFAIS
jgi:hypothetical protein